MSATVSLGQDLPLSANHNQFQVYHHLLSLNCDLSRKVFRGCMVVFIRKGTEWSDLTEFRVVLDCSDIEIEDVEEIIETVDCDLGEVALITN